MTHIDQLLDQRFPTRDCSLEEATKFLEEILKDHTVDATRYSLCSTDGEAIELMFSLDITLSDGRSCKANSTGWYDGGKPQTGVDLIKNFTLLSECESMAWAWLDR